MDKQIYTMARISINKASQDFNISRNTLYKHIKQGKITKDANGKLDTIDLVRLYGTHVSTQQESTTVDTKNDQVKINNEQFLLQKIDQLQHQVELLEKQLEYVKANETWLKQQLDQKLIEHKSSEKKGLLGRIFG